MMRRKTAGFLLAGLLMVLPLTGCGMKIEMPDLIKATPTPAPVQTQTPTPKTAPEDVTPMARPTITPAPRLIGSKTGSAGQVQFVNSTGMRFRQVYLQAQGGEGWGRNLLPTESSIHVNENFALYYPQAGGGIFNFLFQDDKGNSYELDSIPLSDMNLATLSYDRAEGDVFIIYQSLSESVQKDTRATSTHQGEDYDEDDEEYEYDYDEDEEESSKKKKKSEKKEDSDEDDEDYDEDEEDEDYDEDEDDYDDEDYFEIDSEDYYYYNPEDEDEDWSDESEDWEEY